ncbi:MAG: hypothetical protein V7711_09445 [Pseudomonadales bacterium]
MTELFIGIGFALLLVFTTRERPVSAWIYTATLPWLAIIYIAFALYAGDLEALGQEIFWGIPLVFVAMLLRRGSFRGSVYLVACAWLAHGLYDVCHDLLFINEGVPKWYPLLCAGFDLIVALYLVFVGRSLDNGNIRNIATTTP